MANSHVSSSTRIILPPWPQPFNITAHQYILNFHSLCSIAPATHSSCPIATNTVIPLMAPVIHHLHWVSRAAPKDQLYIKEGLASSLNSVVCFSFRCCRPVNPQFCFTHAAFNYWAAQGYEPMLSVINKLSFLHHFSP